MRPNVLGMVRPLILLVKNVALLIVMKPAVILVPILAQTVAAAHVNVAHQPPPPALHQAVVHHQVVHHLVVQALEVVLHHQVVLHLAQEIIIDQITAGKIEIVQEQHIASNHLPIGIVTVLLIATVIYIRMKEIFSVIILVNMFLEGITKPKQNVKTKVVILTPW